MSNCDTQLGWFYMQFSEKREVLCYRCNRCSIFSMISDNPARAFCCGVWKTPPKESFWSAAPIPRLPYIAPRSLTVMPGSGFEITD
jgi:hypothetical protein